GISARSPDRDDASDRRSPVPLAGSMLSLAIHGDLRTRKVVGTGDPTTTGDRPQPPRPQPTTRPQPGAGSTVVERKSADLVEGVFHFGNLDAAFAALFVAFGEQHEFVEIFRLLQS